MSGEADLPRLLKRLYRFRRDGRRGTLAGLWRRQRKTALLAALRRDWRGGYVLTDRDELAFVPAPLDARGEHVMFYGFDIPAIALRFAPPGGIVVDVGANLGEWSVPLAQTVGPAGRVLCCEPNPTVAAALAATLAINNLRQARVLPLAISTSDSGGHLAIDPTDSGRSHLAEAGTPVNLRSLDSVVAEAGIDRLDLLKIDVEGHETEVFAGATGALSRFRPAIIFESGHESGEQREAIADQLHRYGYDIVAVLHHYGAVACNIADYRAARGGCAGREARNLAAWPRDVTSPPAVAGKSR